MLLSCLGMYLCNVQQQDVPAEVEADTTDTNKYLDPVACAHASQVVFEPHRCMQFLDFFRPLCNANLYALTSVCLVRTCTTALINHPGQAVCPTS